MMTTNDPGRPWWRVLWERLTPWLMTASVLYFIAGRELARDGGSVMLALFYLAVGGTSMLVLWWYARDQTIAHRAYMRKRNRIMQIIADMDDAVTDPVLSAADRAKIWTDARRELAATLTVSDDMLKTPPPDPGRVGDGAA